MLKLQQRVPLELGAQADCLLNIGSLAVSTGHKQVQVGGQPCPRMCAVYSYEHDCPVHVLGTAVVCLKKACCFCVVDLQGLLMLSRLTSLTKITMSQLQLTDVGLGNIGACTQLKMLDLDIHVTPQTPSATAGFLQLTRLTGLQHLDLFASLDQEIICHVLVSYLATVFCLHGASVTTSLNLS